MQTRRQFPLDLRADRLIIEALLKNTLPRTYDRDSYRHRAH